MNCKDKKLLSTKIILDRLCSHVKVKNYKHLAAYLGIPSTRVYSWKKYGKISDVGIILVKNPELNPGWLFTGEGEMLVPESKGEIKGKESKILMTISPGPARKEKIDIQQKKEPTQEKQDLFDEEDAIEQTRYILRSETVYRGALHSNIRAFYQGAKREEEMAGVSETMAAMKEQMTVQNRIIERMEEMLKILTGSTEIKEKTQGSGKK